MSEIQSFYDGQNIFITGIVDFRTINIIILINICIDQYIIFYLTGGTGYFGKILIEKLLRIFPNTGTIYMLIRQKKGKDVNERLKELFKAPVI